MPKRWIQDHSAIAEFLAQASVGRLSTAVGGQPYIVPVAFVYHDERFYFHSAPNGRKMDAIRANPRVCFEVDQVDKLHFGATACAHGMRYTSVIAFGEAQIISEPDRKRHALEWIIAKYAQGHSSTMSDEEQRAVEVVEIVVDQLTAKRNVDA